MIDEMQLGFAGYCPVVALADVYQQAFELFEVGKRREAFDMFGRILAFDSIAHADQYLLVARGIFKEDTKSRPMPGMGNPANKPSPSDRGRQESCSRSAQHLSEALLARLNGMRQRQTDAIIGFWNRWISIPVPCRKF